MKRNLLIALILGSCAVLVKAQSLRYCKNAGGTFVENGTAIHVSSKHNAYSFGSYLSDTIYSSVCSSIPDNVTGSDQWHGLITKHDSSGTCLWMKSIRSVPGATCSVLYGQIVTDASENLYLFASYTGTVDVDPGAATITYTTESDSANYFLAKYDATGALVWSFRLKTENPAVYHADHALALDKTGNPILSAYITKPTDMDPGVGTKILQGDPITNFVAKYSAGGNYVWAYAINVFIRDICVDNNNQILLTGSLSDTTDIRLGGTSPDILNAGPYFFFIGKYNSNGIKQWAYGLRHYSTAPQDGNYPEKIRCDTDNNVYIAGILRDTVDFDPGPGIKKVYSYLLHWGDVFVAKYSSAGAPVFAAALGGEAALYGFDVGKNNTLYFNFAAIGNSFDIDFTSSVLTYTKAPVSDNMILHTDANGSPLSVFDVSTPYTDHFFSDLDEFDGSLHLVGQAALPADFDPSPTASYTLSSFGSNDMTVTRYHYYPPTKTSGTSEIEGDNNGTSSPAFPNPTERHIKIDGLSLPARADVYNGLGQKVLSVNAQQGGTIDLGSLANGIYIVATVSTDGTKIFKVIKE